MCAAERTVVFLVLHHLDDTSEIMSFPLRRNPSLAAEWTQTTICEDQLVISIKHIHFLLLLYLVHLYLSETSLTSRHRLIFKEAPFATDTTDILCIFCLK